MKTLLLSSLVFLATFRMAHSAEASDLASAARSNNEFAADLLGKLESGDGNLFFSPFSIHPALAMTSLGAGADTLDQMRKTLLLSDDADAFQSGALGKQLIGIGRKGSAKLSVANALWIEKTYELRPAFIEQTRKHFAAKPESADFQADAERERGRINKWVARNTNDKIKDLLHPGDIGADTRLVLTNAIYFKGDWASSFKKKATRDDAFHQADGTTKQTPFMNQTGDFGYRESDDLQILELPYKDGKLSMLVLLPKKGTKHGATPGVARFGTERFAIRRVAISMPKFKFRLRMDLGDTLESLGMTQAFDARQANFSRMTDGNDLFISKVVHEAFVDVNEEGTEAAAATGVVVTLRAMPRKQEPVVFKADRPFVFLIRENESGAILFLGRVAKF